MPEGIVQFNEKVIKGQTKGLVRVSVEETLNKSRQPYKNTVCCVFRLMEFNIRN